MSNCKKPNIIFLIPGPIYKADLPNFKDKFAMLSENFKGEIYSWSCEERFENYNMGSFVYRGLNAGIQGFVKKQSLIKHIISNAIRYHKQKKVDVIVCYDPIFTGVIGFVLKIFLGVKLIIEINSAEIGGSIAQHYSYSWWVCLKDWAARRLSFFVLRFADGIKFLSVVSKGNMPKWMMRKRIFYFHDFVPTHYFHPDLLNQSNQIILSVGFPFYLKGMDVLISAYQKILVQYPNLKLLLIGHKLETDAKEYFKDLPGSVMIFPGMYYDKLKEYFQDCYACVLASRTEGMGRVLIEAMASGKPVIGSNVGGIPGVIQDGRNGFLFESENVDDLADKLDKLLSDPELAKSMGIEGRNIVKEKFSSEKYMECFKHMIDFVLNKEDR